MRLICVLSLALNAVYAMDEHITDLYGGAIRRRTTPTPRRGLNLFDYATSYSSVDSYITGFFGLVEIFSEAASFEDLEYFSKPAIDKLGSLLQDHVNLIPVFAPPAGKLPAEKLAAAREYIKTSGDSKAWRESGVPVDALAVALAMRCQGLFDKILFATELLVETPVFRIFNLHRTNKYRSLNKQARMVKMVQESYLKSMPVTDPIVTMAKQYPAFCNLVRGVGWDTLAEALVDEEFIDEVLETATGKPALMLVDNVYVPLSLEDIASVVNIESLSQYSRPEDYFVHNPPTFFPDDRPKNVKLTIVLLSFLRAHAETWGNQVYFQSLDSGQL